MRNNSRAKNYKQSWAQELLGYLGYYLLKFGIRLCGVFIIAFSCFTCLSLLFYKSTHTSWNMVKSEDLFSPMGKEASILSDVLYQSFGWFSWLFPILILSWGIKLTLHGPFKNFKKYLPSALLGFILICFSLSSIPFFHSAIGKATLSLYMSFENSFFPSISWFSYILFFISFPTGLLLYGYALGIPRAYWRKFFSLTKNVFKLSLSHALKLIKKCFKKNSGKDFLDKTDYSSFSQGELDYEEENPSLSAEEDDATATPIVKKSIFRKKATLSSSQPGKKLNASNFHLPSEKLIQAPPKSKNKQASDEELEQRAQILQQTLEEFGIKGDITEVNPGPVVTLYEFKPAPGVKTSRIIGLADDIARSMSALSTRVSVIPGKNAMGIELPNEERETVFFRPLLKSEVYVNSGAKLPLILGRNIGGVPTVADLSRMPHLLVAGTTGSGKSVAINTMILSLVYYLTPDQCKFIMIDPKMLELSVYEGIPHLLTPVVTDPKKAVVALKWAVREMEDRYQRMSKIGVRNIEGYNQKIQQAKDKGEELTRRVQTGYDKETGDPIFEQQPLDMSPLPYIVIIVDEMADLMLVAGKEIEATIQRLAQMARAAGIHLIMATQRPSVDVITGTIKANFPTRISFQVSSKIDSRTILSEPGAEQLLGQGDMLFLAGGGRIQRIHGPFVTDENIGKVVQYLQAQKNPEYIEEVTKDEEEDSNSSFGGSESRDPLFDQVVDLCLKENKASTSFIQRHFQIGYNRAARIMDQLEEENIVSPPNHTGRRQIRGS